MSLAVQKLSLVNHKAQDNKRFCIFTLVKFWAGHGCCWRSHKQVTRIGGTINSIWIHYILHHYARTPSHKCKSMIKVGLHLCLLPGWCSRLEYKFNCFITIWKSEVRNQHDQTSWAESSLIWNSPICRNQMWRSKKVFWCRKEAPEVARLAGVPGRAAPAEVHQLWARWTAVSCGLEKCQMIKLQRNKHATNYSQSTLGTLSHCVF